MIYAKDRDIYEFHFKVLNKPGQLRKALEVIAKYGINILNISAYSLPEWKKAPVFIFADLTNLKINIDDFKKELERVIKGRVYIKKAPCKGFMMDEFAFPLYVFPGIRSLIISEVDFKAMIKGIYDKLGDLASMFLFHLAFAGGMSLAKYLSEKLKLKGKELLKEIIKIYQAGGWCKVELVEYDVELLNIVLRLYNCIECKIFKGSGKPSSHFIRGHLSGIVSELLKIKVKFIESKCIAKGDPYCEFYSERLE